MEADERLQRHARYGYLSVDPMPSEAEIEAYYRSRYYEEMQSSDRRLREDARAEAEVERQWMRDCFHADVADALRRHAPEGPVLDVGAGLGELVDSLQGYGFEVRGLEPSGTAVEFARARGLSMINATLESYAEAGDSETTYAAVLLANILEHVRDPMAMISQCAALLKPGGVLMVRVPNDFSEIQEHARAAVGAEKWWVKLPDHLHYFSFDSLEALLVDHSFSLLERTADFPMELFLLMGDDYIGRSDV